MIRTLFSALFWFVSFNSLGAGIEASVDKRALAVGQQLTLTLRAEQLKLSLDELNLQPLQGDFEIFDRAFLSGAERRGKSEVKIQTLELGLIALRPGRLTIPRLQIATFHSRAIMVEVSDGSADFPKVIVKTGFLQPRLYERNEAILFLDLYDDSTLQWRSPKVSAHSMQLRPLPSTSRFEHIGPQRYRVTRFAWGAMPLSSGNAVADFALLDATHFGERVAFRAPAAVADVGGVPTYLPATVHIGRLELAKTVTPHELRVGRPEFQVIEVRGRGLSVEGLRKSIAFPASDEALFFYKPQLSLVERDDGSQVVRVAQAFKPLREGNIRVPELRIPFFDPLRREIETLIAPAQAISVSDPLKEQLLWGGVLVAVLSMLIVLFWRLRSYLRGQIIRFRAMYRLSRATTPEELLRGLNMQKSLRACALPSPILAQLEALRYGRAAMNEFKPLRDRLLREIKRHQRERRAAKNKTVIEQIFAVGDR